MSYAAFCQSTARSVAGDWVVTVRPVHDAIRWASVSFVNTRAGVDIPANWSSPFVAVSDTRYVLTAVLPGLYDAATSTDSFSWEIATRPRWISVAPYFTTTY